MSKVVLTAKVTMTWESDQLSAADTVSEAKGIFRDYLTGPENPFRQDYGRGAFGGWNGPYVSDVSVDVS